MPPLPPHSHTLSDTPTAARYTITTLDSLPSDITRLILDHYILSRSKAELLPLLRSCSSLYVECAPLLYKEVVLDSAARANLLFRGLARPERDGETGPYVLDDLSTRRAELLKSYAHPVLENYPPISPKYILLGLVRKLVIESGEAAAAVRAAGRISYVGRQSMEKDQQRWWHEGMEEKWDDGDGPDLEYDVEWHEDGATPHHKIFSGLEWLVITQKALGNWSAVSDAIHMTAVGQNVCFQLPYNPRRNLYYKVIELLYLSRWEHVVLHNVHLPLFEAARLNDINADRVTIYAAQETRINDPRHTAYGALAMADNGDLDPVDDFIVKVVTDPLCCISDEISLLTICDPAGEPLFNNEWMQQWVTPDRWDDLKDAIVVKQKSESSCCEGCGNKVLPWAH
ncbi:hypothetical protein IAT38_005423 [Cryptococcus sp. DSM 104549]